MSVLESGKFLSFDFLGKSSTDYLQNDSICNKCFKGLSINSRWLLTLNALDCSSWLNKNYIMDLFRLFSNTCTCTFLLEIVNSLSEKSWNTSCEVDSMTNCPKFLEPSDGQYLGYTWQKLYAIQYILFSRYNEKNNTLKRKLKTWTLH